MANEDKKEYDITPIVEKALRNVMYEAGVDEKTPTPLEETVILGRLAYLLQDPHVYSIFDNEFQEYAPLKLVLSSLSRTTNFDPVQAQVVKYRAFTGIDLILLTKPKDKITWKELAFVELLKAHVEAAVADAIEGWRGRLTTEQVKSYKVEPSSGEGEKKRWWEKVFGR